MGKSWKFQGLEGGGGGGCTMKPLGTENPGFCFQRFHIRFLSNKRCYFMSDVYISKKFAINASYIYKKILAKSLFSNIIKSN